MKLRNIDESPSEIRKTAQHSWLVCLVMHFASGLRGDPDFDVRAKSVVRRLCLKVMTQAQQIFARKFGSIQQQSGGKESMDQSV